MTLILSLYFLTLTACDAPRPAFRCTAPVELRQDVDLTPKPFCWL